MSRKVYSKSEKIISLSEIDETLKRKKFQFFLKRLFDIIFSLFGLIILLPIFLIIAIAIKIDSNGPVFFKQTRVGKNGKEFKILKFRTMIADAEKKECKLLLVETIV